MSISGVQGHLLEVTVVGCTKLKDSEWIKRQDPYICLEYGSTKFRTRTCTVDGNKNPFFHERFTFTLIEGLREIKIVVWNNNYITYDDFIGSRKVQLADVLSWGYDHRCWPLQSKTGRYAGDVILVMHYNQPNKPVPSYTPSAPPYTALPQAQLQAYSVPPPESTSSSVNFPYSYPSSAYPSAATTYPPSNSSYHGQMHYLPRSCPSPPAEYSSGLYPPRPDPSVYPPMSYPPAGYPAAPYLHPQFASHYGHPGIYRMYTRPPY